jgi:hypothetical protein
MLSVIVLGAGNANAERSAFRTAKQTNQKQFRKEKYNHEPIEVLEYRIKGNKINENEKFDGGTRWLQGLTIKIKNRSEKPIRYIHVSLTFHEALIDGRFPVYDYDIGHRSEKVRRGNPIFLIKNDVTTFELTDRRLELLEGYLQKRGYRLDDLTKVDIGITEVRFTDNTMWLGGEFYVVDPNAPSGWRIIRR